MKNMPTAAKQVFFFIGSQNLQETYIMLFGSILNWNYPLAEMERVVWLCTIAYDDYQSVSDDRSM